MVGIEAGEVGGVADEDAVLAMPTDAEVERWFLEAEHPNYIDCADEVPRIS